MGEGPGVGGVKNDISVFSITYLELLLCLCGESPYHNFSITARSETIVDSTRLLHDTPY